MLSSDGWHRTVGQLEGLYLLLLCFSLMIYNKIIPTPFVNYTHPTQSVNNPGVPHYVKDMISVGMLGNIEMLMKRTFGDADIPETVCAVFFCFCFVSDVNHEMEDCMVGCPPPVQPVIHGSPKRQCTKHERAFQVNFVFCCCVPGCRSWTFISCGHAFPQLQFSCQQLPHNPRSVVSGFAQYNSLF